MLLSFLGKEKAGLMFQITALASLLVRRIRALFIEGLYALS